MRGGKRAERGSKRNAWWHRNVTSATAWVCKRRQRQVRKRCSVLGKQAPGKTVAGSNGTALLHAGMCPAVQAGVAVRSRNMSQK